jgi:outer membrane protein assembly factor BamB
MSRRLAEIERPPALADEPRSPAAGYLYRSEAHPMSFGFELADPDDLLTSLPRTGNGALASLLCGGSVFLRLEEEQAVWRANGPPFLTALELARQASELSRALEAEEGDFLVQLSEQPALRMDLRKGGLQIEGRRVAAAPVRLAQAMFELGLALSLAIIARHKAQRKNPYLRELMERCREGLRHLPGSREPPPDQKAARSTRRIPESTRRPLPTPGRLRRLRFTELWKKHGLGGAEPGRILLSKAGPIFSSAEMACAFSQQGQLRYRRLATHGVAASVDDRVVTAFVDRVMLFVGGEPSARWVRDHDGRRIGPELNRRGGILFCTSESRAAIAMLELSGREIWRLAPPRTHRIFAAVQGHRVLVGSESGQLYGLDLETGLVRYRLRATLPFIGPAVPWGRKMVAAVGRSARLALLAANAYSGAVQWSEEVNVSSASAPLPQGNRILVAGEVEGRPVLICLSARGKPIWTRALELGQAPYSLLAVGRSTLVCAGRGGAALVAADGRIEWGLEPLANQLLWPCAPAFARGVLMIPGEIVRAVDPRSGQVLAEVRAGIGLCDLKIDGKLNLYLLDEDGSLQAHRLASHFAVVS